MRYVSTDFGSYVDRSTSAPCVENGVSQMKLLLTTVTQQAMYERYYTDLVTQPKERYYIGQSNVAEVMIP